MKKAWVWPVYRLESDDYSVPRGALGVVDEIHKNGKTCHIRWLPPNTGGSLPVALSDLVETNTPLTIPEEWVQKEFE